MGHVKLEHQLTLCASETGTGSFEAGLKKATIRPGAQSIIEGA